MAAQHTNGVPHNPKHTLEQIYSELDPEQTLRINPIGLGITDDEFTWFVIGLACARTGFLERGISAEEKSHIIEVFASAQGVSETAANHR